MASSDLLIEKLFQAFDLQISLLPHYRKSILKSRNTTNAAQVCLLLNIYFVIFPNFMKFLLSIYT